MKKILILLLACGSVSGNDIISNNGLLLSSSTAYDSLLPIFTRKQKFWENGNKIIVYIKPLNSIEHSIFITEWLGISRYRYKKLLKKEIYSGNTDSVKEVLSDDEMIISVLNTPGSIGYLTDGTLIYSYIDINDPNNHNIVMFYYE